MATLVSAISYIHSHNVVHRDLKLENILLKRNDNPFNLKIIDFGISGLLSNVGGEVIHAGTMIYSPPEVVSKSDLATNPRIDVWSLGVILYVLITKEFPFYGDSDYKTFTSIMKDKLKFPKSYKLSKEVRHLLHHMLDKNPILRYTIEDIKIHPWISHLFKDEGIERKFYDEINSNNSDFYDDTNPENKFNNSKKLFKDQMFLTKITINNKTSNINNFLTKSL